MQNRINKNGFENKKTNRLQFYYTFLNAFPTILIFTNLSFYLFPFMWRRFRLDNKEKTKFNRTEYYLVLAFLIGVTISMFDIWTLEQGISRVSNGMAVWPNYAYWTIIILMFSIYRKQINWRQIGKACFWGLVASILYFYIPFLNALKATILFKGLQQNTFSFILIIFTPLALYYSKVSWGKKIMYLASILIVLSAALSGSRAGAMLVTVEIMLLIIYFNRKSSFMYFIGIIFFCLLISSSILIQVAENIIYDLNPRAHGLIYEKDVLKKDPSYLTRVAVVEKGISLFKDSPITGVGINNFSKLSGIITFNFEGGKIIKHNKDFIQRASAHNSYLSILCETGLIGFIPFILLLIVTLFKAVKKSLLGSELSVVLLIGFSAMLIHLYVISAILNVFAWFYIALVISNNDFQRNWPKKINSQLNYAKRRLA